MVSGLYANGSKIPLIGFRSKRVVFFLGRLCKAIEIEFGRAFAIVKSKARPPIAIVALFRGFCD